MNLSRRQRGCIARMLVAAALAVLPAGCSEETGSGQSEASGDDATAPAGLPGEHAFSFIDGAAYPALRLELGFTNETKPAPFTQDHLKQSTAALLRRPADTLTVYPTPLDLAFGDDHPVTLDDLRSVEASHRTQAMETGSHAAIWVQFLPGHFVDDTETSKVLGAAYGSSSIVIFQDTIRAACMQPTGDLTLEQVQRLCEMVETTTLIHELGHLVGLVDNGIPMVSDHRDPDHGNHDTNPLCIMYWQNNTLDLVENLRASVKGGDASIALFGEACEADIDAAVASLSDN